VREGVGSSKRMSIGVASLGVVGSSIAGWKRALRAEDDNERQGLTAFGGGHLAAVVGAWNGGELWWAGGQRRWQAGNDKV
jgi:hypothetical protein